MGQMTEKQIMLTIGISGVLLSAAAFGGVYWTNGWIEEENVRIKTLDKKIADAEKKKARIPKDENDVVILRENVAEYVKILPERTELTNFTRTVNSFTQNSGVAVTSLQPANRRGGKKSAFRQYQYNLSFTGSLWQFMKFMNMFESYNRFVKITNFRLVAGKVLDEAPENVIHTFSMSVVTYTYNKAAGKKPVTIPNYNAKRDRLREEIYRARQAIRIEKYAFRGQRARRDVWVDPRVDPREVLNDGIPLQEQLARIEKLQAELESIRDKHAQSLKTSVLLVRFEMARDVQKRLTKLGEAIEETEARSTIRYRPYVLKFQREIREPYEALSKKIFKEKGKQGPVGIPLSELTAIRKFMEDALIEGRLADAVDRFELVREKLSFPPGDERSTVAKRLQDLYRKAKIAQDFSHLDLKLSGIILIDAGLSTAIINGKTYTEGDALGDSLFLKEIGAEYTEFLYRGVVLRKKR